MSTYTKTLVLGNPGQFTGDKKAANWAKVEIEIDDNGELHMVGDMSRGKHWEGGGQCQDAIAKMLPYDPKVQRIVEVWNRWHLNHLRAGDSVQEAWLRENGHGRDYTETCARLAEVGLLEHGGYTYGHAWLKEDLPAEIIEEITSW